MVIPSISLFILNLLVLVSGVQGLVISGIIFFRKPSVEFRVRGHSLSFLFLFFVLIALGCFEMAIEGIFYTKPNSELPFPMAMTLAYIPALFFHLKYLGRANKNFQWSNLLHFLPAFVLNFAAFFLIIFESNTSGLGVIDSPQIIQAHFVLRDVIFFFQFPFYLFHIRELKNELSFSRRYHKQIESWYTLIQVFLMTVWMAWIIQQFDSPGSIVSMYLLHSLIVLSIYFLGHTFLLKRKYFEVQKIEMWDEKFGDGIIEKIKSSKIYQIEKVSLPEVSNRLNISEKEISKAINGLTDLNFNEYINLLRIEDYSTMLTKPEYQKFSLFGLAQEVGFSSKSSFHRSFKKVHQTTPKEYLKRQKE